LDTVGIENPIHLLFIAVVALVVLGPRRLPDLARALGKGLREFREALSVDEVRDVHDTVRHGGIHEPVQDMPGEPVRPAAGQPVHGDVASVPVQGDVAGAPTHGDVAGVPVQGDVAGGTAHVDVAGVLVQGDGAGGPAHHVDGEPLGRDGGEASSEPVRTDALGHAAVARGEERPGGA